MVYFAFAGVLQVAGAGSIAPFIAVLANPEILRTNRWLLLLQNTLELHSQTGVLIAIAGFTLVLLVVSNLMSAFGVWLTFRFSFRVGAQLQEDLLCAFLHRDYVELARTNSSDLIAKISHGATRFTYNVLQPLFTLISQITVVAAVVLLLAWYRPTALLMFAILTGGGYGLLFVFMKGKLSEHGTLTWELAYDKQRLLTEALGGLKEVRLAGTESEYFGSFKAITDRIQRSEAFVGLLGDLPRFAIESLAFCALLVSAMLLLARGERPSEVVELLSVFAMTGYRVLPAAQTIFKSAAQIRSNVGVLEELRADVMEGREARARQPEASQGESPFGDIQFSDVTFGYPGVETPVLRSVSTCLRPSELTVLVGASGSGKSTFVDVLMGLLEPKSGSISIGGTPLTECRRAWQRSIGYVPQSIFLLDESIGANVAFGSGGAVNRELAKRSLVLARLWTFVNTKPEGLDYRVGERGSLLSGGQRQRVGIARALYRDARVLILDEATSALDGSTEHEVLATLEGLKEGRVIVSVAHRQSTIRAADRIIMLKDGAVCADGSFDELIANSDDFRRLFESPDEVLADSELDVASAFEES